MTVEFRNADVGCSDATRTRPTRGVGVRMAAARVRVAVVPVSQEVEDECSRKRCSALAGSRVASAFK